MRTLVKGLRQAIETKDRSKASPLLGETQSKLAKLAGKGILKPRTASRLTSRLTLQANKLEAAG